MRDNVMSDRGDQASRSVPAGGSATINGVLYQLLWSLLRASRARFDSPVTDDDGTLNQVTLVLEPVGGGGDLVVAEGRRKTAEQLKARPDGSTWSLREVVESVIPDLYLACTEPTETMSFRFVTEGRMGEWAKVYKFFRGLQNRELSVNDPLSGLDDVSELSFGRHKSSSDVDNDTKPFWERESYTERTLYERIVTEIRKRKVVRSNENELATQQKLWFLLANFEFIGQQSMDRLQEEIDAHLLAVVDCRDDIPLVRDSMAMDLARRATVGGADINVDRFFQSHNLNAISLTEWGELRDRTHQHLEAYLRLHGYDRNSDVRLSSATETLGQWPDGTPMMAVSGESGQGKSWRAFAIATHASANQELTVVVDATGNANTTLECAARTIWQRIAGHETTIPIPGIAKRVKHVLGERFGRWLTLIIDGVQDSAEGIALVREPWENYGVRVLFTIHPQLATRMERESFGRCCISLVGDFTVEELHQYLDICFGEKWPSIPDYLKAPLRRPLLASLYHETIADPSWRPETEYELYAAFWRRLVDENQLGGAVIKQLVRRFLDGLAYPFVGKTVLDVAGDDAVIQRLERAGWLRVVNGPAGVRFEIAHDRLLNWVAAAVLVDDLYAGDITIEQLGDTLSGFLSVQTVIGGRHLGFVPMDALWMIVMDDTLSEQAPGVLAALERDFRQTEVLYEKLLPTLGVPVLEPLYHRLNSVIANDWVTRYVTNAISKIETGPNLVRVHELLHGDNPLLQRAAMHILGDHPSAEELDRLWELHVIGTRTPEVFLREHESRHTLHKESFRALRECCRLKPTWLDTAIERADPAIDPVHDLAYLVKSVRGKEGLAIWQRNKNSLLEKVSSEQARSIAACIQRYDDTDELDWLLENVSRPQDFVCAMAISALTHFAPAVAVEHLHELPRRELVFARSWYADHLFTKCPNDMSSKLLSMMQDEGTPWEIALIYSGREHRLDASTLDFLLDDLDRRLEEVLSVPDWGNTEPLYMPLRLLSRANTHVAVERFRCRKGTSLESRLRDFLLRIGPRHTLVTDFLSRTKALDVLGRIGGIGFTHVVNEFLLAESRYGRLDAIKLAGRNPDGETYRRLAAICRSEDTWEGFPLEQSDAVAVLMDTAQWETAINTVMRLGMRISGDVTDLARRGLRPSSEVLAEVRSTIRIQGPSVAPGPVLTLGFGNPSEDSALVRSVLSNCDPDSDLAHACVIALDMMRDMNEESVPLLSQQLGITKHEHSARNALIVNGTQAALRALREHVPGRFSVAIAINLINHLESPEEVIQGIVENMETELEERGWWNFNHTLDQLLERVHDDAIVQQLIKSRSIREHVRTTAYADEGRAWTVGSKVAAIRCLAKFDAPAAFLAAKTALQTPDWHDREHYPHLLMDIDTSQAIPVLIDQLTIEESQSVANSICRALLSSDISSELAEWLESGNPITRRTACILTGWVGHGSHLEVKLRASLDDEDEEVVQEAVKAIDRWHLRSESQQLGQLILSEEDASTRWILLDCLLGITDPGDEHCDWPIEGPEIGKVLSPLQIDHVCHRLEALRKEAKTSGNH